MSWFSVRWHFYLKVFRENSLSSFEFNVIFIKFHYESLNTDIHKRVCVRACLHVCEQNAAVLGRFSTCMFAFQGLIIAFTSSFIHRAVYRFAYSRDGTLNGYVNNSLAYFNLSDFSPDVRPNDIEIKPQYNKTQFCR